MQTTISHKNGQVGEPLNITDKNGRLLFVDDWIFNGEHYFRLHKKDDGEIYAFACTYGYIHNLTQKETEGFVLIGTYNDNKELSECD